MNSQDFRNLQEAYLNVYQELDEAVYGGGPKKTEEPKDTRLVVTNADKKGNTPAYQNFKKGDKRYRAADHMDEATAMAKRGLDEPAIRNKIASTTRGGESADRATKLADKPTYGDNKKKEGRENLARKQRGTFRDTTSSSPGLRGYGHKSSDPAVKAKQDARGAQRGRAALTPNERKQLNMEFDFYDLVLSHLLDEGYADTNENALVIMANMSEDWRENICEGYVPLRTSDDRYDDEGFPTTTRSWSNKMTDARIGVGKVKDRSRRNSGDPIGNLTKGVSAKNRLDAMKKVDDEPESVRANRSQAKAAANRQLGANRRSLQTSLDREHLTKSLKSS